MKTLTRIIYAVVALAILSACEKKTVLSPCVKPTLDPPSGSGSANDTITVHIKTATTNAHLRWTDVPGCDPATNGFETTGKEGDAITVYGRTLRVIAVKANNMDPSPIASGIYSAIPTPTP
jgi:hypothetical protein